MEYVQQRSFIVDFQILLKSLGGWISTKGNIKARGNPSVEVVSDSEGKDRSKT